MVGRVLTIMLLLFVLSNNSAADQTNEGREIAFVDLNAHEGLSLADDRGTHVLANPC